MYVLLYCAIPAKNITQKFSICHSKKALLRKDRQSFLTYLKTIKKKTTSPEEIFNPLNGYLKN